MNLSRNISIIGTGVAVPATALSAENLDLRLGLSPGESQRVTGIRQRFVSVNETAAQLAVSACEQALNAANFCWADIDCLVCASATMDQALPYNAAMIHAELGPQARGLATLDIGASCLSFLQAVDFVSCALAMKRYNCVMIVSADVSSFTTDYANLRENGIFGDGAGAAILRRSDGASRILASKSITLPEGVDFCRIRSGGTRFHRRGTNHHANALFEMRGRPLFALVARHLPDFVAALLAEAHVDTSDITWFIPHQASKQALDHVAKMLGFHDGRMIDVFSEFGNQVGASLPTALHFAIERYGMKRGDKALLLGSGAGVSLGGIVFIY